MRANLNLIKMIRVNFSGSIFFFFLLLLFSSCSSPGNDGVELGEKFCNCLGDFKTFKDPNQFKQVMDSCEESIKVD